MSGKKDVLSLLLSKVGQEVTREEIAAVTKVQDWPRRIRDLRDAGWQISTTKKGYTLKSKVQGPAKDNRGISQKLRYKIMQAAFGACQSCGARIVDGAVLVIDHKVPVAWGGKTVEENLWPICTTCNAGKKHFYSDENAEVMRQVMAYPSAKARILALFRLNVGKKVTKDQLMMVAQISEWARRVRDLRKEGWVIHSNNDDPTLHPGEYILKKGDLGSATE